MNISGISGKSASQGELKSFRNGFTLLEVIVALSILAVSMLAIEPLIVTTMRYDKDTWFKVKARELVIQKIDDIAAQDVLVCDALLNIEYVDAETGTIYAHQPTDVPLWVERTWMISGAPGSTTLCTIKATVTYNYKTETLKTITLITQKSRT